MNKTNRIVYPKDHSAGEKFFSAGFKRQIKVFFLFAGHSKYKSINGAENFTPRTMNFRHVFGISVTQTETVRESERERERESVHTK